MKVQKPSGQRGLRGVCGVLALALGILLLDAILTLPGPEITLALRVGTHLDESGVMHPVTAVLLNFRGYDTLLEIAVLLLAVLGIVALRPGISLPVAPPRTDAGPVLGALLRLTLPLVILAAGYLLWAGAHRPGGAFQAAAVLAGGGVLLRLTGLLPPLRPPGFWLRAGLLLGFAVFLIIAVGSLVEGSNLLEYRGHRAGLAILLAESALTLSIALILIVSFIGAAPPRFARPPATEAVSTSAGETAKRP